MDSYSERLTSLQLLVLGFASLGLTITWYGAGHHLWDVDQVNDLPKWLKVQKDNSFNVQSIA